MPPLIKHRLNWRIITMIKIYMLLDRGITMDSQLLHTTDTKKNINKTVNNIYANDHNIFIFYF